ncbi:hypothetical protein PRZ48_004148 [Zasmidium cellare]|uniref:Mediator of RNA polymerase II transcription subunit 6 n=1 Tax=Zasmidium cellare TaxID=395010 RepID=A0ABR0EZE6_ZASCE|nr:hypothetical protein PRZ48_004148 [Zasmidium cellare]
MAAVKTTPLDDLVWNNQEIISWWVGVGGQRMDENMIHRYFSESPFFDWTSKNGFWIDQGKNDFTYFHLIQNRKEFEATLRSREGVEFLIVDTPQLVSDKELAAKGTNTGIYVIRKQDRKRVSQPYLRPPHVLVEKGPDGKDAWELTILGTYYIVGENVLQASSVYDIISNRLLVASASLNKLFDVAGSLPRYTPGAGFHYLPRSQKPTSSTSVPGTPARSREGSVAPGPDDQSLRSGSVQPDSRAGGATSSTNLNDTKLLTQSLRDVVAFQDDYIDENPLLGEPGSFRFSASTAAIKKRRADEEAAAAKAKAEKESANTSRAASPKAPTPPAINTELAKVANKEKGKDGERRGSKKGDKSRRKSRVNAGGSATSPTTPSSATSTQAPNSAL